MVTFRFVYMICVTDVQVDWKNEIIDPVSQVFKASLAIQYIIYRWMPEVLLLGSWVEILVCSFFYLALTTPLYLVINFKQQRLF